MLEVPFPAGSGTSILNHKPVSLLTGLKQRRRPESPVVSPSINGRPTAPITSPPVSTVVTEPRGFCVTRKAVQLLTDEALTTLCGEHQRPVGEGRVVAQMLLVAALEQGRPVSFFVLDETRYPPLHSVNGWLDQGPEGLFTGSRLRLDGVAVRAWPADLVLATVVSSDFRPMFVIEDASYRR